MVIVKVKLIRSVMAVLGLATGMFAMLMAPVMADSPSDGQEMAALLYADSLPATYQYCYE